MTEEEKYVADETRTLTKGIVLLAVTAALSLLTLAGRSRAEKIR